MQLYVSAWARVFQTTLCITNIFEILYIYIFMQSLEVIIGLPLSHSGPERFYFIVYLWSHTGPA